MRAPTYLISLIAIVAILCLTGGGASADPPGPNGTVGGTTFRTETTTVVEGGQQIRIFRIFNNEVLVYEVRNPLGVVAGFESAPTGQVIVIVEGLQSSAPSELAEAALSQLPSTSTAAGTAGLAIGFAAISVGLALLRRRTVSA